MLAVKCFAKECHSITILLQLDNCTVVAYINLGGTVSPRLHSLAKESWLWCLERDINLVAQHLPGVESTIAEEESRVMNDRSDWMLNPVIVQKI